MHDFFSSLALRNTPLNYFGWICLVGALGCGALTQFSRAQVVGVNARNKPCKFLTSSCVFV